MKLAKITKHHGGDKYIFIGQKAIVPNMRIAGKIVEITMKEFKEIITQPKEENQHEK